MSYFIEFGNEEYLIRFSDCFIRDKDGILDFRAASDYGRRKLKGDWPKIWDEFDLDNVDGNETT